MSYEVLGRFRASGSAFVAVASALGLAASIASAQPGPDGFDWVTIGAAGNAAWTGGGFNNNRGSVPYEYRIGRTEVTTAQWAEFMNAAIDRPANDRIPFVFAPTQWGATGTTPQNPGGQRFRVPAGREMLPTGGVDWRTCAVFCNWLTNGKSSERSAFLSGAYNVSTFGYIGDGGGFTDQLTRSPSATYWIPSLDEWMKAAHYDPNKPNADGSLGGWWTYSNSSDQPYAYGPPGVRVRTDGIPGPNPNGPLSTANAGWDDLSFPGYNPYVIPLGAYGVTSPWGLLDCAGGTSEWTEAYFQIPGEPVPRDRLYDGSGWVFGAGGADLVRNRAGGAFPSFPGFDIGLRLATSVPTPSTACAMVLSGLLLNRRRRRLAPASAPLVWCGVLN